MRDILTGIAIVLIVALTAALAIPPFIDWEARRDIVERVIRDAVGVDVETDGRIRVRLLPSPRLRLDGLAIGDDDPRSPAVRGRFVTAEVALMPLLKGEFRFVDARVGRLDIRVPAARDGSWTIPRVLVSRDEQARLFAFEQMRVAQFAITSTDAATGRTEQIFAQDVTLAAPALSGPWRVEGTAGAVPFRVVTGEPGADGAVAIKAAGGGDRQMRFDLDGRVQLAPLGPHLVPRLDGQLKVQQGGGPPTAADAVLPVSIQTTFKSEPGAILLEKVAVEVGDTGSSLRLAGLGRIDLKARTVDIGLDAKRLDLDALRAGPAWTRATEALNAATSWRAPWPTFIRFGLGSVGLAGEEISEVGLSVETGPRGLVLHRVDAILPGTTRTTFAGEASLGADSRAEGHVDLESAASDRLSRFLREVGVESPWLAALDGRRVALSADILMADQAVSLRRMRVEAGEGTITGALRYQIPALGGRGKLEALVAAQNLDLAQMPRLTGMVDLSGGLDLALTIDARGLRDGTRAGAGRVAAKIVSDGPSLVVETLDITDLAGANMRVAGRIAPDGAGRIAGKVTAQRAAPLVDLIGRVWSDTLAATVPPFLREGGLDLDIALERDAGAGDAGGLTTIARGTAAGGRFAAEIRSDGLGPRSVDVTLATPDTARWLAAAHPAVNRRPAEIAIKGARGSDGRFSVTGTGEIAGVRLETLEPFSYLPRDASVQAGSARIVTADLRPVLALFALGMPQAAAPADLRLMVTRERGLPQLSVGGRIAGDEVRARFSGASLRDVAGDVTVGRLSLPLVAELLTLGSIGEVRPPALWSAARFGDERRPALGGQARLQVGRLDLGRGVVAENATVLVSVTPDGLSLRDLEARLGDGRVAGAVTIGRARAPRFPSQVRVRWRTWRCLRSPCFPGPGGSPGRCGSARRGRVRRRWWPISRGADNSVSPIWRFPRPIRRRSTGLWRGRSRTTTLSPRASSTASWRRSSAAVRPAFPPCRAR